ncbi:hypothetical protein [Geomicrobium sediminis]|uniref:Ribulose-5-phosphate 4-epimerase/fuculose-1-phosphate aldolase n=1 Tax=Geomicrobium sediminis TaxID=1347788 RepID=A0ABS2PAP3_9BACL|nr:hypothetical protein [Geomicrobium sediminis]MBM7632384.1 ribulose-5-phosphate 4-epimerase/fuculose-1-phosphate aldolase [Geomicrobium sediminis]
MTLHQSHNTQLREQLARLAKQLNENNITRAIGGHFSFCNTGL